MERPAKAGTAPHTGIALAGSVPFAPASQGVLAPAAVAEGKSTLVDGEHSYGVGYEKATTFDPRKPPLTPGVLEFTEAVTIVVLTLVSVLVTVLVDEVAYKPKPATAIIRSIMTIAPKTIFETARLPCIIARRRRFVLIPL